MKKKLKCNVGQYAVILNQDGKILVLTLAASKKYPKESKMLPGGRLLTGEKPEQALQREIREETGLKVKIICPCHVSLRGTKKSPKYEIFFLCKLFGNQEIKLSKEHIKYEWISPRAIRRTTFHNINSKLAIKKSGIIL